MANEYERTPTWLLWLLSRPLLAVPVIGLIIIIPVLVMGTFIESRIGDLESTLEPLPPAHYTPPSPNVAEADRIELSASTTGQRVYVPVYSHIYFQGGRPLLLETTLSIRNTSPESPITINTVDYYDTSGELVREYLDAPIQLQPLATTEFLVERSDAEGGSGANFIVEWVAGQSVNEPLVETVMVGINGPQAISFSRTGRVLVDNH